MARALLHADLPALRPVSHAFVVINDDHIVLQTDRLGRANLDTHFAGDAARFAHFADLFSGVLSAARDPHPRRARQEFYNFFRTRPHAGSTTHTGLGVDNGKTIDHGNRIKGARFGAFPQADARVETLLRTAEGQIGPGARPVADIMVFLPNLPFHPGATNRGHHGFDSSHFFARNLGYGFGHLFFARKTEVRLHIGVIDHSFGIGFAPGVAASASLSPCENFQDFFDLGIGLHSKLVGGKGQPDTEQKAYGT